MEFGITIPLQNYLHARKPPYGNMTDPLFCWEVHRFTFAGKDALIAANASNRFCVLAAGLSQQDWADWQTVCVDSLAAVLRSEGLSGELVEAYLDISGPSETTKTHGRRSVAGLNLAVDYLQRHEFAIDAAELVQLDACSAANRELCKAAGFAQRGRPVDFLRHDLSRLGLLGG